MDRRAFLASTVGVVAAPLVSEAQQAEKVARVGVLRQAWHATMTAGVPILDLKGGAPWAKG